MLRNLLRRVEYNHGRLMAVYVYGYIDGMRMWRTGYSEWAGGNEPDPPEWMKEPPRDKRYTIREVRKYDDSGRLTELLVDHNNGERWSRMTYTYDGDLRIGQLYTIDEQVSSKSTEKLDTDGHVVEMIKHANELQGERKWVSRYQLDEWGNWIFQRSHLETTVGSQKVLTLESSRTRKIAYFPQSQTTLKRNPASQREKL